jgi:KilA-N domain
MAANNLTGKDSVTTAYHRSGSLDFLRSGAYANLNDIAKLFGKRVDNWMRLDQTTSLLREFSEDPSYKGTQAIYTKEGRSGGTWAHPDIAIQFAQWCSPGFALWVSRQIRHLMAYGEVNLNYREWTEEQHQIGRQYNRDDVDELYGRRDRRRV